MKTGNCARGDAIQLKASIPSSEEQRRTGAFAFGITVLTVGRQRFQTSWLGGDRRKRIGFGRGAQRSTADIRPAACLCCKLVLGLSTPTRCCHNLALADGEARGPQRILCAGEDSEHAQGELIELGVCHELSSSLTLAGCFRSSDPCRASGGVMKASLSTPCSFRNAAPFSFSRNPSMRAPARLMKTL